MASAPELKFFLSFSVIPNRIPQLEKSIPMTSMTINSSFRDKIGDSKQILFKMKLGIILINKSKSSDKTFYKNQLQTIFLVISIRMENEHTLIDANLQSSTEEEESQQSSLVFGDQSLQGQLIPSLLIDLANGNGNPQENSNKISDFEDDEQEMVMKPEDYENVLLCYAYNIKSQAEGEQLYSTFISKLQQKEELMTKMIKYKLTHRAERDCDMNICMLYLCYINYYYFKHHERKLKKEFDMEQLVMIRTNSEYCRIRKFINIDYYALGMLNYQGRENILSFLAAMLKGKKKELDIVLQKLHPTLFLIHEKDMNYQIKSAVRNMHEKTIEDYYSKVDLDELLCQFQIFTQRNHIRLEPSVQQMLAAFQN